MDANSGFVLVGYKTNPDTPWVYFYIYISNERNWFISFIFSNTGVLILILIVDLNMLDIFRHVIMFLCSKIK